MEPTNGAATTAEQQLESMPGAFVQSLTRGSKKIQADRALVIAESAQLIYKRSIEDLEMDIKTTQREQANQLDLSPNSKDSLVVAKDFNAADFVTKDQAYTVRLRELRIKLEEYKARYEFLFGGPIPTPTV